MDDVDFRAHGPVFFVLRAVGVASCGAVSCASGLLDDGGAASPYVEGCDPALPRCGDTPHFGGGLRAAPVVLRMRLSLIFALCWSRVISFHVVGS